MYNYNLSKLAKKVKKIYQRSGLKITWAEAKTEARARYLQVLNKEKASY